jgi:hypothetical protein
VNLRKIIIASGLLALGVFIVGCGGSGNGPNPSGITVSIANAPGSMVVSTSANIVASVSNDGASSGVTWTISCGGSACGNVSPAGGPGNNPDTTYTAPTSIPSAGTVTLTATSVADTTASASATIAIKAKATPVIADGNYVYRLTGQDQNGPYFVAGVFTVLNGAISAGEQDYIDLTGGTENNLVVSRSSLTPASNGNFQLVVDTGNSNLGVNGVETFRGTLASATHAQINEFDSFATAGGTIDLQTSTAAPAGGYAFNLGGVDGAAQPNPLFIGGVLTISANSISVANSVFDYFDGGSVGQNQGFTSGTLSAPDSLGRVTITLTPTQASGGVEFELIGYIVGTNRIQFVESATDTLGGKLGGTALGQGASAGNFSAASVGGNTYVFMAAGEDAPNGGATFAGGFSLDSNGTVSGVLAYNDGVYRQGPQITGGNWSVDSLGRVALTKVTTSGSKIGNGPFAFQLYLDGDGNALELGSDAIEGSTGTAFVQTTSQVNPGSYAIAAQGVAGVSPYPVWAAVGPVTINSSLNWSGFTDYNVLGGTPVTSMALSGTTNASAGLFSINGLNAVSPMPNAPEFGYYPINDSSVLAIEMDNNQLGLFIIEAINP